MASRNVTKPWQHYISTRHLGELTSSLNSQDQYEEFLPVHSSNCNITFYTSLSWTNCIWVESSYLASVRQQLLENLKSSIVFGTWVHKFEPQNIYNMVESGLFTVHNHPKIIAHKETKQAESVTSGERNHDFMHKWHRKLNPTR